MKFCNVCNSWMTKDTLPTGEIIFSCVCGNKVPGVDEDTLISELYLETEQSDQKHETMIRNSPHDMAANVVSRDCGECGRDYMTIIYVGVNETVRYTCKCGASY
jgi:DNA-directed RNA polymerase subunit M/transcription elongation factor TFIIS